MSNKLRLQTNNTNLQALIDKANALPDAGSGSGGSTTMVTGVFEDPYESFPNNELILNDGSVITIPSGETKTFNVAINSIIAHLGDSSASYVLNGGITQIKTNDNGAHVYMVTDDFTIRST